MKTLMHHYFFRLFKSKFYIACVIVSALIGLLVGVIVTGINLDGVARNGTALLSMETPIRLIFNASSLSGGSFPYLFVLALASVGSLYSGDVKSGGFRSYIVSGYNRKKVYITYFICNFLAGQITSMAFAIMCAIPCLFGRYGLIENDGVWPLVYSLALLQLIYLSYYACYYFFVTITGTSAGGIGIFIGIVVALSIFCSILALAYVAILSSNKGAEMTADDLKPLGYILLIFPSTHLSHVYSANFDNLYTGSVLLGTNDVLTGYKALNLLTIIVEHLGLTAAFFFGGLALFKHKDMK